MRKILFLWALLTVACSGSSSVNADQQFIVTTTPGTTAPAAGAMINSNFAEIYGKFAGQIFIAASGDTSGTADLAALNTAVSALAASNRLPPLASQFFLSSKIVLGPGTFYFTAGGVNLVSAANTKKLQGLWIEGSGRGVTSIDYNPASSAPFLVNNRGLDVKMTDISFVGHDANSDFLWSQEQAGLTNVQDYTFVDVAWSGTWGTLFRLTGGNNNSEWKFDRVTVGGNVTNGVYTPPAIATTITSGSSTIAATNTASQVQVGDTGFFSSSVAPLTSGTSYYVVAATTSGFQVATTFGGSPVSFTASGTPNFTTASDQFLNFWFDKLKWDTGASLGQLINMNFGGSIKIRDSDISGHAPSSVAYVFNLLGSTPHSGGTMNFLVDGLRVEHSNNNSRLIQSTWTGGTVSFNNLDESSQAGNRTITNAYAFYNIVNNRGPTIEYRNSQLMGVHNYVNNSSNFNFQSDILYENVTLLDNPTAANFISLTDNGNSGGRPRIRFSKSRSAASAAVVGYHEIVDTDLYWNQAMGGQTNVKTISCAGSNSDFPQSGGAITIRLPLNAVITAFRYWSPGGGGASGAYQYTLQTTETTPTVLAGGASTPLAGANALTPLAATSQYMVNSTTLPFEMTSDTKRTIQLIDTLPRSGIFTGVRCLIDYIG